ncbi:S41 family peptidase [bacterium]|nr:S41 family peptidase [bacterium]
MTKKQKILSVLLSLLIIGTSFVIGVEVGYGSRPAAEKILGISNKEAGLAIGPETDFSPFWEAWDILNQKYLFPNKTSNQDKVWGAIEGLAQSFGDPYTVFLPPQEAKMFEEDVNGNFEGVGMEIGMRDGVLTVIAPLKGSPAEKAGVKSGDKIFKIDNKITSDLTVEEAVRKIRGPKGTKIVITVVREGAPIPMEITITRDAIDIPTIETEEKNGVFIIRLYSFTSKSPALFHDALREFTAGGGNKLVLDLRGNPGGYLDAAVDIASWFLPSGKVVVKEDMGEHGEAGVERSRGYDIFDENLKMAILVDGGSASAAEILAGALQEHGVAKLVGEKTFGKGSVQELVPVTDDTSLKITIARWLTPNGKSLDEGGLIPDFEAKRTPEDFAKGKDAQLEKAMEIVKN